MDPIAPEHLPPESLLLVADDPALAARLRAAGLAVEQRPLHGDGEGPLRACRHRGAVVDLRRDPARGLDVLSGLRHLNPGFPLLALLPPTPDDDLPLRAAAAGADDFCAFDADRNELLTRVRWRLLRPAGPPPVRVGSVELDPASGQIRRAGRLLDLPRRQHELLRLLMLQAGHVLSRERIEHELQILPGERRSNVVEVHVHHLRRCLPPGQLQTVRGQGYRLLAGSTGNETEGRLRE